MNKMNEKVKVIPIETALKLLGDQINQSNLHSMKEASDTLGKLSGICDNLADLTRLIDELQIPDEQYNRAVVSLRNVLDVIKHWMPEEVEKSKKAQFQLSVNLNPDIERADTGGSIQ